MSSLYFAILPSLMCGRYTITVDKSTIEYRFNAKFVSGSQEFHATYSAVTAPAYHYHLRTERNHPRQVGLRSRRLDQLAYPSEKQRTPRNRSRKTDVPLLVLRSALYGAHGRFLRMAQRPKDRPQATLS